MEIWKLIDGLTNHYISNYGRVKADAITTKFGNQNKTYPERYLKVWYSTTGYNYIDISVNGKVNRFLLHRLVAQHFIDNPENKPQVNHKDGNKNNNYEINLEWSTAAENLQHARDLGLNNSIGCDNKMAKLSISDVLIIRNSDKLLRELSVYFDVSMSTISQVRSFKIYKNVL